MNLLSVLTSVRFVVVASTVCFVLWITFTAGRDVERASWMDQRAEETRLARKSFDHQLDEANKATELANDDARQARDHATTLQEELHRVHVPLVVAAPVRQNLATAAPAAAQCQAGVAPAVVASAETEPASHALDGSGSELTEWAVRVWDAALTRDVLPADSCGPDGPAAGACTAAAGVSIEQALRNHIENAASCSEDRARYQRLIDYLKGTRPATP